MQNRLLLGLLLSFYSIHGQAALASPPAENVMAITVNGALCGSMPGDDPTRFNPDSNLAFNTPCVSVTICDVSGTKCQTISNVKLDTGSTGFRIFKSALAPGMLRALPGIQAGNVSLQECAEFAEGSRWGAVAQAQIILGGEPAVQVPIQIIDPKGSASCPGSSSTPYTGFHALLGIGQLIADGGKYFLCAGATCASTASKPLPIAMQVTNPVSRLPLDNNGVIVKLPGIPAGGAKSVTGQVIFGIGTRANNIPEKNLYIPKLNANKHFTVTILDHTYTETFIDSGSQANVFTLGEKDSGALSKQLVDCSERGYPGWLCTYPSVVLQSNDSKVKIEVQDYLSDLDSYQFVFSNLGLRLQTEDGMNDELILGLPFFFGKNIYVGIEHRSSPLGVGPYWAF